MRIYNRLKNLLLRSRYSAIKPISGHLLMTFFQQLAALNNAGIPLIKICDILTSEQHHPILRPIILAIRRETLAGKPLHQSLRQHPYCFTPLICHLIQIGELTGKLDFILRMISEYLEKQQLLKRQIKQALFYPLVILSMGILLTLCLFLFVIPRFAELFNDHLDQLPAFTRYLFVLSGAIQRLTGWPLLIMIILFYFIAQRRPFKREHPLLHIILSRLPILSVCRQKIILARFARTLALTYGAGIPIIDALKLSGNACQDRAFTLAIAKTRTQLCAGLQLYQALAMHALFPPLMIQMIKTGEESGMLEIMLEKIAGIYEADSDASLHQLSQLLEPLIMVILGALIGGLVIGMYLPIFKLGSLF